MIKRIPFVGLKRQHRNLKKDILRGLEKILNSSKFILGEEVNAFEKRFTEYTGVKYAVGVNSGTDALFLALKVLNIGPRDEIITVSNSFVSTAAAIVNIGATPVFVDIKDDFNINPESIEQAITSNTKAIIPVHFSGHPCDMDRISEIAKKHNLKIIEDCAQAVGAEYKNKKVGSLGDIGCFSLHPLKILNACGDGGVITTDKKEYFEKLLCLRNNGLKNRNELECWGYNSRLDSIQAAILNEKFNHLEDWITKRIRIANEYNYRVCDYVRVPKQSDNLRSVYHTYIIQTEKRDLLKDSLQQNGIETKIHYPTPIHLQLPSMKDLGYKAGDLVVTEKMAETMLSLPIYPELAKEETDYICEKIILFFSK